MTDKDSETYYENMLNSLNLEPYINQYYYTVATQRENKMLSYCANICLSSFASKDIEMKERACLEKCFYNVLENTTAYKLK